MAPPFITASWPAPRSIKTLTTTRAGGFSVGCYESFNLGDHVGDSGEAVQKNRARLRASLALPTEPLWLKQVHGTHVVNAQTATPGVTADGAWTDKRGVVLAVLTADCLPIFLCDKSGTRVALLHAGWRGLAAGVVESGVKALGAKGGDLIAHLGPGIGPDAYEVGVDVRAAFVKDALRAEAAFRPSRDGHWWADVYALAWLKLRALGVEAVTGGEHCTFEEKNKFFSYRRDGVTGRMASLMWME
jgi:hypothetical protein